eukprot:CAMPEP_0198261582 /NCGR_PEP_ID=MMETSP1447-20131203/10277_1 /TAXON_ID=420782 /ORGANISM="Chaetoceros dichaeta, Strain CCMP1751" /LENGTH=377 /DNA_ID=CAMNT_0043949547 /DNA_START=151 /DNA_END=1284 /DNA_ORIENTATION=+
MVGITVSSRPSTPAHNRGGGVYCQSNTTNTTTSSSTNGTTLCNHHLSSSESPESPSSSSSSIDSTESTSICQMDTDSTNSITDTDFEEFNDKYEQRSKPSQSQTNNNLKLSLVKKSPQTISIIRKLHRHSGNNNNNNNNNSMTNANPNDAPTSPDTHTIQPLHFNQQQQPHNNNNNNNNNNDYSFTKSVRWSNMVQMKDVKFEVDSLPDGNRRHRELSISEIAGNRLYQKGIEREKRLALLRKHYHLRRTHRPSLLGFTNNHNNHNHTLTNSTMTTQFSSNHHNNTSCIETCERLYALSKPRQEQGKKRRHDILKAILKRKETWVHTTKKISSTDASRLYYNGMRQVTALERRRSMASQSSQSSKYKSYVVLPKDME